MMRPELSKEMLRILGELSNAEPGYSFPVVVSTTSLAREAIRLLREIGVLSGHDSYDVAITIRGCGYYQE